VNLPWPEKLKQGKLGGFVLEKAINAQAEYLKQ
jgi:hypothetical protein